MKRLILKLISLTVIISLLQGCSNKEYIYLHPPDYKFVLLDKVEPIEIGFETKEELKRYESYIKKLRLKIDFYEDEIKRYEMYNTSNEKKYKDIKK